MPCLQHCWWLKEGPLFENTWLIMSNSPLNWWLFGLNVWLFRAKNIAVLAMFSNKYPLQRDIFCIWSFALCMALWAFVWSFAPYVGWSFAPPGWLKRSFWVGKKMGPFGSFWIGSNWSPLSFLPCSAVALLHASQAHLSALRAAQLLKQYCSSLRSYCYARKLAPLLCCFSALRAAHIILRCAPYSICSSLRSYLGVHHCSLRSL
jgi:hypothetical protein